jgi:hypothetical protein
LIPDLAAAKKGAVGQVGKQFVGAETAVLINEAIAEAEASAPKSAEYVALEAATATAKPQQSAEERARIAEMNAVQRRMDDRNSDL